MADSARLEIRIFSSKECDDILIGLIDAAADDDIDGCSPRQDVHEVLHNAER
jgi:hypothetical protein